MNLANSAGLVEQHAEMQTIPIKKSFENKKNII